MAVEFLNFNGEKLPFKVGYYVLKMLQQEHGMDMASLQSEFLAYEPVLFYALRKGHELEGKEFKYKMSDMENILEECFFEFVDKINNFFPDELTEKMKVEGGQKKTVSRKKK